MTFKAPTFERRATKRSHAAKKGGLSADQRTEIDAVLASYGAHLTDDDRIAKGNKVMSVQLEAKGGRLKMVGGGNVLASYPASRVGPGVSDFVEKFWFWKKDAITSAHATKKIKKSPKQLQREIDEALAKKSDAPRRRWNVEQEVDTRPGFYYVTAIDGPRKARIAGPYNSHELALDAVETVKNQAYGMDPRSHFWAWGTMRSEADLGKGALGVV